jgi:hypothetical protein
MARPCFAVALENQAYADVKIIIKLAFAAVVQIGFQQAVP